MHREDSRHMCRSPHQSLMNRCGWNRTRAENRTPGESSPWGAVVQSIPGAHTMWGGVRAPTAQVEALLNTESVSALHSEGKLPGEEQHEGRSRRRQKQPHLLEMKNAVL